MNIGKFFLEVVLIGLKTFEEFDLKKNNQFRFLILKESYAINLVRLIGYENKSSFSHLSYLSN